MEGLKQLESGCPILWNQPYIEASIDPSAYLKCFQWLSEAYLVVKDWDAMNNLNKFLNKKSKKNENNLINLSPHLKTIGNCVIESKGGGSVLLFFYDILNYFN